MWEPKERDQGTRCVPREEHVDSTLVVGGLWGSEEAGSTICEDIFGSLVVGATVKGKRVNIMYGLVVHNLGLASSLFCCLFSLSFTLTHTLVDVTLVVSRSGSFSLPLSLSLSLLSLALLLTVIFTLTLVVSLALFFTLAFAVFTSPLTPSQLTLRVILYGKITGIILCNDHLKFPQHGSIRSILQSLTHYFILLQRCQG